MNKQGLYTCCCVIVFLLTCVPAVAQKTPKHPDTFFLAKKTGILGMIGRSISTNPPSDVPVRVENPFLKYKGKIVRSIQTIRLGFEYDFDDTTQDRKSVV